VLAEGEEGDWEAELPAWADNAVANLAATADKRRPTPPTPVAKGAPAAPSLLPPQPAPQPAPQPITTPVAANDTQKQVERMNLERRQADRGPPNGAGERRIPRTFGRRSAPH
jgi:hypothetical protein